MRYIVGIDEVGRGCLAGPVTVAVLAIPENFDFRVWDFDLSVYSPEIYSSHKNVNSGVALRDSKKLSSKQRAEWVERIKETPQIKFAIKSIQPRVIDEINIANAANLAAYRALKQLVSNYDVQIADCLIFLDGGLYIKSRRHQEKNHQNAQTIIKGDEQIPAVSLASIIAKVDRDKYMGRLSKAYPKYGFEVHKGYATKVHRSAIKAYGPSEFHRVSFIKNVFAE